MFCFLSLRWFPRGFRLLSDSCFCLYYCRCSKGVTVLCYKIVNNVIPNSSRSSTVAVFFCSIHTHWSFRRDCFWCCITLTKFRGKGRNLIFGVFENCKKLEKVAHRAASLSPLNADVTTFANFKLLRRICWHKTPCTWLVGQLRLFAFLQVWVYST